MNKSNKQTWINSVGTGDTLLHHAVSLKRKDLVKMLILAGIDPRVKNKEGI